MWFLFNILFEFFLYLIVDNLTKIFLIKNRLESLKNFFFLAIEKKSMFLFMYLFRRENRFDILISECFLLGFLIGFISIYHHITYVLIVLLFIHIIGTLYTERRFDLIGNGLRSSIQILIEFFRLIFNRLFTSLFNRSSPKVVVTRKLPEKYLYTYHLKPTNDLRLQQVEKNNKSL
jgi:hypothetical protein